MRQPGRYRGEISAFINNISDYIYLADVGEFDETIVSRYLQDDARFVGVEVEADIPVLQWSDNQYLDLHLFADHVEAELDGGANDGAYSAQKKTSLNEGSTASYNRLDAFVDYHFNLGAEEEVLLFVKARNLTDEEIRNHTSFLKNFAPEPGRSIELGLRYIF